ncbi:hypothetical protein FKM82_023553, partial [Ascaphus truei]
RETCLYAVCVTPGGRRVYTQFSVCVLHACPSVSGSHTDVIRSIRDPEKPSTLEELEVVSESCVSVQELEEESYLVIIRFTPTVPHCSLATLIGLCLRVKLQRCLPFKHKLEIYISEGTHTTEEDINKQINDKERVAAAMENPGLREIVEQCVTEPE